MDTINLAEGGSAYVGGTYFSLTGADLTGVTVQLALGTAAGSQGNWRNPTVTISSDRRRLTVKLLVGGGGYTPLTGQSWLWGKFTNALEVDARRLFEVPIIFP